MSGSRPREQAPGGPRSRSRAPLALLSAVLAVVLSACGVGNDPSPKVVAAKTVPYGLLHTSTPTTTANPPSQYVTVYFGGPQRLVAVSRAVPAPATIRSAVEALAQGPTNAESAEGLVSPISTATPLTVSHLATPTVRVTVGPTFTSLSGKDQTIAVAQLVYTVTAFPGVTAVDVRLNGKSVAVPTGNGSLGREPLGRKQFASLAPL